MYNKDNCLSEMNTSISAFSIELKNIRTGRVSPDILKSVIVESYGSKSPLTQLSNINNIDNMTLSVNIWDVSLVKIIEKSILDSNLGVTPQSDGNNILLKFPELTAERRKELVKFIAEIAEKFKVSIRTIRRKYLDEVKNLEKEKSLSIDELNNDKLIKHLSSHIGTVDILEMLLSIEVMGMKYESSKFNSITEFVLSILLTKPDFISAINKTPTSAISPLLKYIAKYSSSLHINNVKLKSVRKFNKTLFETTLPSGKLIKNTINV